MPVKITKRSVDAAEPGTTRRFLFDTDLKGFGLSVTPAGAKSYFYSYRMGGRESPSRRHTIGPHGSPWTPETARAEARRLAELVARGIDPIQAERQRREEAVTLEVGAFVARFIDAYLKPNWKDWRTGARALEIHVVPRWRGRTITQIARRDVIALRDDMTAKGMQAMARLTFATLRRMMRWAVEHGHIPASPLTGIAAPKPVAARDRVLTDDEVRHVWQAAGALGWPFSPIVRLLLATGARREEVASLDWSEIDMANRLWRLPAGRAKNATAHTVPLNNLAMATLADALGTSRGLAEPLSVEDATKTQPRRELVFTTNGKTAPSGFSKAKARLDALIAARLAEAAAAAKCEPDEIAPWRLHDLRRTVATNLQRLGVRLDVTEAVLNHISGSRSGIVAVYQRHTYDAEKRAALDAWGERLASLIDPQPAGSNVVPMQRRAG